MKPTDREQTQAESIRADIYVRLHVVADLDPARVDNDEYVLDRATDAIYKNDVLDASLEDMDWSP